MKIQSYKKYLFEGLVIFFSVFLSLYVGNLNEKRTNFEKKQQYIIDLIEILNQDIFQVEKLMDQLNKSEKFINSIQNDIDSQHNLLSDSEVIDMLIDIEVGFSFFPKDGIFNQMISTGTFELIKNNDLKMILLEMYNHQKERNFATSKEIDEFNLMFRNLPYSKFKIRFDYNLLDGEFYGKRNLTSFKFDNEFYLSNEFYGLLSQAKIYSNMYKRQLNDILKSNKESLLLSKEEVKN
ncbi:MAG: hypothetical protein CMC41_03320 [Flavobacteriaceae bacterium]|nr:hypothetical protein [Flavobacteriaceae bacterium]